MEPLHRLSKFWPDLSSRIGDQGLSHAAGRSGAWGFPTSPVTPFSSQRTRRIARSPKGPKGGPGPACPTNAVKHFDQISRCKAMSWSRSLLRPAGSRHRRRAIAQQLSQPRRRLWAARTSARSARSASSFDAPSGSLRWVLGALNKPSRKDNIG